MESLLRSLGVSDEILSHLDKAVLAFQRPYIFWVGLIALIPIGTYIYRRQRDNLSTIPKYHRVALTMTRIIIVFILISILAGPHLKLDERITKRPIVAVLVDTSQSMTLPAGPLGSDEKRIEMAKILGLMSDEDDTFSDEIRSKLASTTRAQLAQAVIDRNYESVFAALNDDYEVRYYAFGDRPESLTYSGEEPFAVADPLPSSTHIGDAIEHALNEAAGQQIAGIWILSDGQNTGGASPASAARAAAEAVAPVFATPFGSPERIKDIAIVDVYTSGLVSVGDDVQVNATIHSQGFAKKEVQVELRDGDDLLDSKPLILRDGESQQIELSFEAETPGPRSLTVSIAPEKEELEALTSNNSDAGFVRISKDKLNVLLIDGIPRWDFRFLKNAARRDSGLQGLDSEIVDVIVETEWRRLPAEQKASQVPSSVDQLKQYQTIIVGDVSPALLTEDLQKSLVEAVRQHGVGLIVAAGPNSMPHAYGNEWQELLPIRLTRPDSSGKKAPVYNPFRLAVTPAGSIHETMRLYDEPDRNEDVWANMPAYYWSADVERLAAGATALAWNSSLENQRGKVPIIAHHFAGDGRVLFVGTDSTWLWRQNVGDRYFYKFWGQAIRFVAHRDEEENRTSSLQVRPVRALPGEEAEIELLAYNSLGEPIRGNSQTVTLAGPDGTTEVELTADKKKEGRYTGRIRPTQSGMHQLSFLSPAGGQKIETALQVLSPKEFRYPNLNRLSLAILANATAGLVLEPEEVQRLPEYLEGDTEHQQLRRESTLWDNWLTLLILILTYSFDVGLRRLTGLT